MSETVVPTSAITGDVAREHARKRRPWDRLRWAILACWIALAIVVPLTSERTGTWADVKHLVADGAVTSVTVSDELTAGDIGFSHVQVHWRHRGLYYVADVVQVRDKGYGTEVTQARRHGYDARTISPSTDLVALRPGLAVTRDDRRTDLDDATLGFHVPFLVQLVELGLVLAGVLVMTMGPEPWRATRWAWFWLQGSPVGVLAFLLLSGPTRPIPWPKSPRRLTGGWAFLLNGMLGAGALTIHFW